MKGIQSFYLGEETKFSITPLAIHLRIDVVIPTVVEGILILLQVVVNAIPTGFAIGT